MVRHPESEAELIERLGQIWSMTTNTDSTITKLHQDVASVFDKELPHAKYELSHITPKYGIEVDMLVTEFQHMQLPTPLALEINGVYHYPRNSQQPLGKDILKEKILTKGEKLDLLTLPYYDLYILEERQKASYIEECVL